MSQDKEAAQKQNIKVRYNETSALFASQFIINSTAEDLTINFSSGALSDPGSGETILPIHTRIALTMEGARRLQGVLNQVLNQQQAGKSVEGQAGFSKLN
jgi:hypothetical protein